MDLRKSVSRMGWVATAVAFAGMNAMAASQVGTITQIDGQVKLFTNPGKTMSGPGPHALYEGEYYSVQDAVIGQKVERGNIVRTAPGAKARVIFDNGDQYNVGPATAYRVFFQSGAGAQPQVNLMYGKIRAVIEKGGPRAGLNIKTRTATMGVRGTDLYVVDRASKGTEVSVIRGEVAVKTTPQSKPIPLKAGSTAEVPVTTSVKAPAAETGKPAAKAAPAQAPVVSVRPTTQQDLAVIQRSSEIKKEIKTEELQAPVAAEIKKLEQAAVKTTLKDIKIHDPKLYEQVSKMPTASATEINNSVVATASKVAPQGPDKASDDDLERLDDDTYNKYFKIVD